jgi:diguanylate cyclase (GGDEF)-like protein/PAS domain S-box-containing protein
MLSRLYYFVTPTGHRRARGLLVVCSVLIGAVLAAVMSWCVVSSRNNVIEDAVREMRNDALMLADGQDRLLQAADALQVGLIEHMRAIGITTPEAFAQRMAAEAVHQNLADRVVGLPYVASILLFDRNGTLINFSRTWPVPAIDRADRDYIRELTRQATPQPYVSEPFVSEPSRSETTGLWIFHLGRRFETADGQLIGIVVSTIQINYFEAFYARLPLTGGGAFSLFRNDGVLLARYPHADSRIGHTFAGTPNFTRLVGALDGGLARHISLLDDIDRLLVPHAMPHFPLIVTVSDTMESILGSWHQEIRILIATTLLLELVIAASVVLAVRHLRSHERLLAAETARARAEADLVLSDERVRAGHALHLQEQRFDTALQNMAQGLLMADHAGHLLVVNRRFCELFGLPPDVVTPRMTYDELILLTASCGNVEPTDAAAARLRRIELVGKQAYATFVWELADGRAFTMTHQPMEEGWLTTVEDITDRRAAEARIAHLAHYDAVTGLPNRVLFREALEHALVFARRGHLLALHYLDLDQFKAVNDTLGHPVGDALLLEVARRLQGGLRETDTVARLGGDEFAIVQTAIESPTEATALASRLIDLIGEPLEIDGHQIVIGTSIGIAFAPEDGLDADQLLKSADLALYRAKADGRGVYRLFQTAMDAEMQARRRIELDLRHALRNGEFEVYYQPLVDLHLRAVSGFEALLRWHHPQRGPISPGTFIPLAEENGAIVPIGAWVLRQACAAAATWPDELGVSVNISPAQFRNRDLVAAVAAALRDAGLSPARLELEITETVMLHDTATTLETLHQLRRLGVRIAMDDFGTGYSSLSYLRRFPFDRIKIDQSFVRELGKQHDCGAIIRAVIALSHDLGMAVTAEGVETREQLSALALAGCSDIQGYLFSRPVPLRDIPAVLRTMPRVADLLEQSELVA